MMLVEPALNLEFIKLSCSVPAIIIISTINDNLYSAVCTNALQGRPWSVGDAPGAPLRL